MAWADALARISVAEFNPSKSMNKSKKSSAVNICVQHSYSSLTRRSGFTRSKKRLKRGPLKTTSNKHALRLREYKELRALFLKKHPTCALFAYTFQNRRLAIDAPEATDIHHAKGRAGTLLNDTRYWIPLTRTAHREIELNPAWAMRHGFTFHKGKTLHDAEHAAKCLEHQMRVRI